MPVFWGLGEGFQLVHLPWRGIPLWGLRDWGSVGCYNRCGLFHVERWGWLMFLLLGCGVEGLSLLSVPLW